ncbi:MAG: glycosyltransferase [Planctomycetes bacterium]|nr:glycosyltransferase [Planctomycetota bacterium]
MTTRNILIVPIGSAGDVHPFVGIGAALKARGHRVTILTSGYFRGLVEKMALDFVEIGTKEEFEAYLKHPDAWHPTRALRFVMDATINKVLPATVEALKQRNEPGNTIVVGSTLAFGTRVAQEAFNLPTVTCHLSPSVFRTVYDMPCLPGLTFVRLLPKFMRRLMWKFADATMIDNLFAPPINAYRATLGLPPVRGIMDQWWHSPQRVIGLFPDWFGPMQPDWPRQTVLTSFPLFDEREIQPLRPDVEEFLAASDKPLVFTPGSAMVQGEDFFAAAAGACKLLGCRGILLTRFPDQLPRSLPDNVRHFDFIPLSTLLPRAACMVYHGGVGTCGQALAAGTPQLIMPMAHDQPDNAARVKKLGVGADLPPKKFTAARLAKKLDTLLKDPALPVRCTAIATKMKADNPIPRTCELIEAAI